MTVFIAVSPEEVHKPFLPKIKSFIVSESWLIKRNLSNRRAGRSGVAAIRLLGLLVWILLGAWMSVSCDCFVLSVRCLCVGLITRPEESYRLWCVVECDIETWIMRTAWPIKGCCVVGKRKGNKLIFSLLTTVSRRRSQEVASRRLCTNDSRNFRLRFYEEKELYSETNLRKYKVIDITGPLFRYSKPSRTVQALILPKALLNRRSSNWVGWLGEHKLFLLFNDFSRPYNWAPVILEYDTPLCLSYHYNYTVTH